MRDPPRSLLRTSLPRCWLRRSRRGAMAQAGDAPSKKITMIVGFAPGGGVDVLARVVAQELNDNAGFQMVIENRPGAGSNIAAKAVAGAAPDGATLLFTGNSYAINQTIYRNPGYATADLRPVAIAALDSQGLAVNARQSGADAGGFRARRQGQAAELRLRRLVVAHHRRIRAEGDGEDRSHCGAVPERRAGAQRALGQPRRHHRGADRRTGAAGEAGRVAGARGQRQQTCGVVPRRADARAKRVFPVSKSTAGSASWRPRQRRTTSA